MIERPVERRAPLPAVLGRRVELLGLLACVLLAVIAFRLWYLQVLTGRKDVALANANVVRKIAIPAPRGLILDRDGQVLAGVRSAAVAAIACDELPASSARRTRLYGQLASVLKLPARQIAKAVTPCDSVAPITIEADIPSAALIYLAEHKADFPGLIEEQAEVRDYPYDSMAAQALGYVGQLSAQDLATGNFKGVPAGDIVGQDGLEYQYDHYLLGTNGTQRVQVNAAGAPTGKSLRPIEPLAGDNLETSLDLGLEQEGMSALEEAMTLAHHNGYPGTAAAFVAIDPRNGQVLALGSLPSYNPNVLSQPFISTSEYRAQAAGDSFVDRASAAAFPTGSTFKPIAALAGLESGLITPSTLLGNTPADGCVTISRELFCNSAGADYGANDLDTALEISEDTYFYDLGAEANAHGDVIQGVARLLGLGGTTGLDLPGEISGDVPDAAWVEQQDARYRAVNCAHGKHGLDCPNGPYTWTIGQNVQLATGQGYLLATPLQMAVAYSAIANGGYVVTPHIGLAVETPGGKLLQRLPAAPRRALPAAYDRYLPTILAGLHLAAQGSSGTSDDVFGSFPRPVYGKTGTAQTNTNPKDDQSWYLAYAPDAKRPIVVAVTVEQGGFGDEAAAPAARLILSKWFGLPERVVRGTSTSR
ncbi:MAG TPA: penicillin-binding transpeptidase domain-containing protein [Solirubrobacteraceae bacterium]|nr:penicillin-binding transpeptidase domain-containing protein [Solirubrobacteraceae bacterium]